MKVGLISPIVYEGSTVKDITFTIDDLVMGVSPNCRAVSLTKGLEVKDGINIYEYQNKRTTIPLFKEDDDYDIGDLVVYNCKLHKITGKSGLAEHISNRPKEPEEYGSWETSINFSTWSKRYYRVANTPRADICAGQLGGYLSRWYYVYRKNGVLTFSAKDLNSYGCNRENYKTSTLATTYKFDESTDFKAVVEKWCNPYCPQLDTINFKNAIIRGNYIYMRTHLNLPIEYVSTTVGSTLKYALTKIMTPMDIDGFIYKRKINALSVFDNKDYTRCETYPVKKFESWSFLNTDNFDCIALSKVICDTIDISITDMVGNSLYVQNGYPVNNKLSKRRYEQPVTIPIYMDKVYNTECKITVTLRGTHIVLGDISVGDTLYFGYTNLEFNSDYRDFSPEEQDQWGNVTYIDGVRVKKYTGTVDLKITDYDLIYRSIDKVGGNEVIINGSDSVNNTPTNSISIFQATMMVARFKSIRLKTSAKTNKIEDIATYSFEIEERV